MKDTIITTGDIFQYGNGDMVRIAAVDEDGRVRIEFGNGAVANATFDTLKPVMITRDILEKAGFVSDNGNSTFAWWYKQSSGSSPYSCDIDSGLNIVIHAEETSLRKKVLYLHELQHVFKLIGDEVEIDIQ